METLYDEILAEMEALKALAKKWALKHKNPPEDAPLAYRAATNRVAVLFLETQDYLAGVALRTAPDHRRHEMLEKLPPGSPLRRQVDARLSMRGREVRHAQEALK